MIKFLCGMVAGAAVLAGGAYAWYTQKDRPLDDADE